MSNPRADRHLLSSSDDDALAKQIQTTHAPDGRELLIEPLIYVLEDFFNRVVPAAIDAIFQQHPDAHQAQTDATDAYERVSPDMMELISYTTDKIFWEVACNGSAKRDAKATSLDILQLLSSYSWDAKALLALTAFSVKYVDFWLVSPLHHTNPLAKAVAHLKQTPDLLENADVFKPKLETLNKLIQANIEVTKCIVQFTKLPSQYITPDTLETSRIPIAVYWTIRSIVACSTEIMGFIGMGNEYITLTTEANSELLSLTRNMHKHLMSQLTLHRREIDERKHLEAYQTLVRLLETSHDDNREILKALIHAKDNEFPLYDGSLKNTASLDVLRRKNVLLYISDLELSTEELFMLEYMYNEARENPSRAESRYEVVWLPVVDRSTPWNDAEQNQFQNLQSMMPWYTVYHPSLLDMMVIRYIKEVWHFNKKPLLVVLDPQGKVVNPNAIHMMWIWGSIASPFTSLREEALWKEESWRIDLLADATDPRIIEWIHQGKYICLYGGEDIEWIRRFTTRAGSVARAADILLEMLYVGKSNPREKVRKINKIIQEEKLSHVMPDLTLIWFFWVRLESMWHSKVQHNKTVENDPIMQEIVTMLSFDGSDQGWAVICKGSGEIAKAKGGDILMSLEVFEAWKSIALEKGFVPALKDFLHRVHTSVHCNKLILPGTGYVPEKVVCAECGRNMDKFVMYSCCTD